VCVFIPVLPPQRLSDLLEAPGTWGGGECVCVSVCVFIPVLPPQRLFDLLQVPGKWGGVCCVFTSAATTTATSFTTGAR